MLAVSPATLALAQTANSTQLDPLVVEAQSKKKKTAAKKSSAPKKAAAAAPQPVVQPAPAPSPEDGASTPGGNPYANPNAPYKVEQSASGKLTEPLANTPRTVTAVPKEVIQEKQVRDLRDLAREVPGLTIGSAEGGNSFGAFAIRGYKSSNDIFIDGIRNPGNVVPDVFSVEQVEIYKGPSGGIAGRSTIGGAINLITKQPDLNFNHYEVDTTVGTDSTFRTTVDVNQVVTHDFAVRANIMYDQHDVAGRDFVEGEKWGGLISATAKPTDDLKITLDYYRYRNDAVPDWGVPLRNADNVPITEFGVPRDTWYGQAGFDFMHEHADIGTATIVAKLADGVTLTNRSRIGSSEVDYIATSFEGLVQNPNTPLTNPPVYPSLHHPNRDQVASIYANQTELDVKFKTGSFKHEVIAGIELTREQIDRDGYTVTDTYNQIPAPFIPNPYRNTATVAAKFRVYDATIDTVGLYLADTVHLSDQWIVNGGIRFDDFERDQVGGPTGTNPRNTASVQDDLFSWNVGVVYKPIPIASIYAAYGTSESPVGSELDATGPTYNGLANNLVDVEPQEARAVEVGTKWELFDRRLLVTAALFQTDVDHARTNAGVAAVDPGQPPPANDDTAFAGKYRIRGIELGAAGNITKEWSVFGGLTLLDTEVLASANAPDQLQDVGRRLANIPLTQFSLMSRYQLTDQLALGGTATYGGEVYGGHLAANKENNHTVGWWRFDAFAEYKLTKNVELEVTGLNLTDEVYYDALYQSAESFAFVAPGRAGYLTVKWKYD